MTGGKREQTSSISPTFTKRGEGTERDTDGGRDAETDLASAYCSSAESLHHLKTEHTTAAHRATCCNGRGSEAARDMEAADGKRKRERERKRGGNICMSERNGGRGMKEMIRTKFVLWISAEPELTSTWLMEGISSGLFHLMISLAVIQSFLYILYIYILFFKHSLTK